MTSQARIDANRANAARSTGPRSAAGKARSKLNARRHGLDTPLSALPELRARSAQIAESFGESLGEGQAQAAPELLTLERHRRRALSRQRRALQALLSTDDDGARRGPV